MAEPLFGPDTVQEETSASIDEQRLINALEANIVEADTIQGSEISEQRQRNHIYYAMDRLGNEQSNRSQHISGDVLDAVESQKAYYLEAFFSGRKVMNFQPEDDRDQTSHLATEYVDQVFMVDNDGYEFTRDALHDAMVAKKAVALVEWMPDDEEVTETLQPMPRHMLGLLQQQGAQIVDVQPVPGPQGLLVAPTIKRIEDTSGVNIELMQPERFFRDPNAAYISESAFAGYQEDIARYELVDDGFDEQEVLELSLDYRFRQNEEDAARKAHDSTWSRARRHKRPAEQEMVTVYHSWAWLDLANFGGSTDENIAGTRLYHFVWSQGKLLTQPESGQKWTEVEDGMPFIEWVQYKISHAEQGLCEADVQSDIQWTKSNLTRLIINNQAMVNTSRGIARHGFIKNPRELLDNNIGGTIFAKDVDRDYKPLPTPPLSPASFQVLEELNREKENRNGLSRLAKGLNADAVAKQNADSMVERLTNSSNRRVMRGVRDFAETFLRQIFIRTYNLGVKYDKRTRMAEVAGKWLELNPSQWPKRTKCKIQVALTSDQAQEQANFLLGLDAKLSQDPKLAPLYGLEQAHALLDDVCDLMGVGDTSRYMKQPDDPQVQQQLAMQSQQSQQMMQMQQRMAMLEAQLGQSKDQREWTKVRSDALLNQAKVTDMFEDNTHDDEVLQFDRDKAAAEYALERDQRRPAAIQ